VIRLAMYIASVLDRVAFNKKTSSGRRYTCQYCNRRGERLTVDHVVPRSRGGETSWVNVVAACLRCNLAGQPPSRRVVHATHPGAGASQVRVLDAHAPASARHSLLDSCENTSSRFRPS